MKTVLIILVAFGIGVYGGRGYTLDEVEKTLTGYLVTPAGIDTCRQVVRSAGG